MADEVWSTLVAEPTTTEVSAALAEVHVRAVPIARRNARNVRAMRLAAVGLVAIGGVLLGRAASWSPTAGIAWTNGAPGPWRLEVVPGGYVSHSGPLWRWHVTKWDEYEGARMNIGEAWVELETGMSFTLTATSIDRNWFNGTVVIWASGDSALLRIYGRARSTLGTSRRGGQVYEEGYVVTRTTLVHGQSVVLQPFGDAGDVRTFIRFDGPYAPLGDAPVAWRGGISSVRGGVDQPWRRIMMPAGWRYALSNVGALSIAPMYEDPWMVSRFVKRGPDGAALRVYKPTAP